MASIQIGLNKPDIGPNNRLNFSIQVLNYFQHETSLEIYWFRFLAYSKTFLQTNLEVNMQFWCTKVLFYISAGFCRPSYLNSKWQPQCITCLKHHFTNLSYSLETRTTVIGADFRIGPNNRLLTLTFTLTLACGADNLQIKGVQIKRGWLYIICTQGGFLGLFHSYMRTM